MNRVILFILLLISLHSSAQTIGFESGKGVWNVIRGKAEVDADISFKGKSLMLSPSTTVDIPVKLIDNSTYKVTAWLRTANGETSVTLQSYGFGNDFSISSAKPNWTKVEQTVGIEHAQSGAKLQIIFDGASKAWVDEVSITRTGDYHNETVNGFLPKTYRKPITDFGITQQDDNKMKWMHDARIGMFIHWGLYSGPGRGEWYMENAGIPIDRYRILAYPESGSQYFDAKDYDPDEWMKLAKAMGARYTVLTTMHHDGFALFDSHYIDAFSSKQTLNRDLVKEYVEACHRANMRVGLYKTLINWRYPGYYDITGANCKANKFGYSTAAWHKENARLMKEGLYSDTKTLMSQYGKIDLLFWDGGWIAQQGSDRDASNFWEPCLYVDEGNPWKVNPYFLDRDSITGKYLGLIGMIRKYQPDILMNPRSGWIGDYTCDEGGGEVKGKIRTTLQEKCITLGRTWGYNPAMEKEDNFLFPLSKLKRFLSNCVTRNINFLINVSPDRHGHIPEAEANLLTNFGNWVKTISDAVYNTDAGPWQPKDNQYGFTCKGNKIYVWLFEGFKNKSLTLPPVSKGYKLKKAFILDTKVKVKASQTGKTITLSSLPNHTEPIVLVLEMNKNIY